MPTLPDCPGVSRIQTKSPTHSYGLPDLPDRRNKSTLNTFSDLFWPILGILCQEWPSTHIDIVTSCPLPTCHYNIAFPRHTFALRTYFFMIIVIGTVHRKMIALGSFASPLHCMARPGHDHAGILRRRESVRACRA